MEVAFPPFVLTSFNEKSRLFWLLNSRFHSLLLLIRGNVTARLPGNMLRNALRKCEEKALLAGDTSGHVCLRHLSGDQRTATQNTQSAHSCRHHPLFPRTWCFLVTSLPCCISISSYPTVSVFVNMARAPITGTKAPCPAYLTCLSGRGCFLRTVSWSERVCSPEPVVGENVWEVTNQSSCHYHVETPCHYRVPFQGAWHSESLYNPSQEMRLWSWCYCPHFKERRHLRWVTQLVKSGPEWSLVLILCSWQCLPISFRIAIRDLSEAICAFENLIKAMNISEQIGTYSSTYNIFIPC